MKRILTILLFISFSTVFSQKISINKIEPPNWWAGHSYKNIQLMVYGNNLDSAKVEIVGEGVILKNVINPKNTNYAFVYLLLNENVKPGLITLKFSNKYGVQNVNYCLLKRENTNQNNQGFSNEDVVYLIFPDRFVNGDTSNDFLANEKEEFEFGSLNGRHGGDIAGIISKLDYLKDLGVSTIWVTPLLENNMYMSYHGYAATNFYKIDPRHGDNELYKELVKKAHEKGIKVIMDHVANHIGINHEWVTQLPTETWFNGTIEKHLPAEHNKTAYVDIHADEYSKQKGTLGWFENYMPDLNQTDSLLARYIIQNTIWWIEYSGIDGIREDTYPYSNQKFMSIWAKEVLTHYPNFNIVGEVWKGEPAIIAAFQKNSYFPKEYDSNLPVVTDFAFRDAVIDYLLGKSDLSAIYETFGKDFVYSNPNNLLVFIDNHDVDRGMYAAEWNIHKFKVALTLTLTTRGIPQLFYGTEIGMDGGGHHGRIRSPFPGGFNDNEPDCFTVDGRNEEQNEIYNFTKLLLKLRNDYHALSIGKLTQFQPKENVYTYIKSYKEQKVLVIINDNNFEKEININTYTNESDIKVEYINLLTGEEVTKKDKNKLKLENNSITILQLK